MTSFLTTGIQSLTIIKRDKISFNDIPRLIKEASSTLKNNQNYSLQEVFDTDVLMRETVRELANI